MLENNRSTQNTIYKHVVLMCPYQPLYTLDMVVDVMHVNYRNISYIIYACIAIVMHESLNMYLSKDEQNIGCG